MTLTHPDDPSDQPRTFPRRPRLNALTLPYTQEANAGSRLTHSLAHEGSAPFSGQGRKANKRNPHHHANGQDCQEPGKTRKGRSRNVQMTPPS